ncbi:MAG: amino acid carrier protein, partial [Phycisphaerae bacterium]
FGQFRALSHGVAVVRGKYDDRSDPGAINHFQALAAALSATIGLGNIGGVALAIGIGGPGALFWMWVVGFTGMALKTIEITLAMMYRDTSDPEDPHGGLMWVIDRTIGARGGRFRPLARVLGCFFCFTLLISTATGGNMYQSWNVADLSQLYFGVPRIGTGIVLAVVVGMVIVGGIKRIGRVAGRLVPIMCVLYLLSCFAVIAQHLSEIPALLALIVRSAFSETEASGAFLGGAAGFAFAQGLQRAMFSNEAGQGSAPIAHAAAKTSEPAREGIVGGLGPFIDTICICTLTALVILSTGTWNRGAVGDFAGPIALAADDAAQDGGDTRIWRVEAANAMDALPDLPQGQAWSEGDQFFLLARVPDNTHRNTTGNTMRVAGRLERLLEADAQSGRRVGDLIVRFEPVELSAAEWERPLSPPELAGPGVYRDFKSAALTSHAFDRAYPGLGKWLVTAAAWLFAISTMISWAYYGEQGIIYLFGRAWVLPYKLVYLLLAILAPVAITTTNQLIAVMDFGTGWMLWSNVPMVILLGYLAVRCNKDYFRRLDAGDFKPHPAPPINDVVDGRDEP